MSPVEVVNAVTEAAPQIAAIPVRQQGWTATTYGIWALVALMTPLVVALTRMWPAMKKLRNEADGSMRTDLIARLNQVESDLREERRDCDRRLTGMQRKMDAVTRSFVQFQLIVARSLSPEHTPAAQQAADRLAVIISIDLEEFMPRDDEEVVPGAERR